MKNAIFCYDIQYLKDLILRLKLASFVKISKKLIF